MPTHLALLRGINVGGRNKLAMAELRRVVASLGHTDASTYIQSGNVVFTAADPNASCDQLADDIEAAIAAPLGREVPVVVVSRRDLRQVVRSNPFPKERDPRALHAVFCRNPTGPDQAAAVAAAVERARAKGSRDDARALGRVVYLRTPDGLGRSQLAAELNRPGHGALPVGTARNWATVTTLLHLVEG